MRIALTSEFTTLDVTQGTLQNISRQVPIEIATTTTKNTGIILQPGENIQFQSDVAVYARSVEMNPEARETPYLAHVPFKKPGEGGVGVYTFKGSVATYADLPTNNKVGDVYDIQTADETHGILAGDNVAWNGTSWDRLAGIYAIMTGATSGAAGKAGLVPAPTAGKHTSYLRGDGTFSLYGIGYFRRVRKPFTLADLSAAVASGNYNQYDILPGDYYTGASGYTYIFAGHNPHKGTHALTILNDHAGLIVQTHTTSKWSETNDTTGGYVSSVLHSYLVNTVLPKVKTDLGGVGHLYAHQKVYSTSINKTGYNRYGTATGCSNNFAWSADQYISALTEMQVYGGTVWSSSGFDTGEADQQLEVFKRFKHTEIFGNEYFWLRDVVTANNAAAARHYGSAYFNSADNAYFVDGLIAFH